MKSSDPVRVLPGIGESYCQKLAKLEIKTVGDLIHHYPSYYQDFSQISQVSQTLNGQIVTLHVRLDQFKNQYYHWGKSRQEATFHDQTGQIKAVWFNRPFLTRVIKAKNQISLSGKVESLGRLKIMTNPEFETASPNLAVHTGRIVPVYPETKGISSKWLRFKIKTALKSISEEEFLPQSLLKEEKLLHYQEALEKIHFPQIRSDHLKARNRLAFNELLLLQLKSQIRKANWQKEKISPIIKDKKQLINRFIEQLPFRLTGAQEKAYQEIAADLSQPTAMNRLLCGDVGSGKTIVAIMAAYLAHCNQLKTLVMAPTQILAQQHYRSFRQFLPQKVKIGLQTASQKKNLKNFNILIGTHALLSANYQSDNIGLIVIDEQHRFGVRQRGQLVKVTGQSFPNILTMTATPIPRSVALTFHGNLDFSFLNQKPKNRQSIKTWLIPESKRLAAYQWLREQIKDHQAQVFIIYPLIESSNKETMKDIRAATTEYQKLKKNIFPDFKLALVHGQIKPEEKNKIINHFARRKIDILIATSIVEVGIDIPGATIMVIENADRFGLAQLHQLRGRVGRNQRSAYCLLFATGSPNSESQKRLKILTKTSSGLKLAQLDLAQRGPGEIFGLAQHGFLGLKLARLTDQELIKKTHYWAKKITDRQLLTSSLKKQLREDKIEPK